MTTPEERRAQWAAFTAGFGGNAGMLKIILVIIAVFCGLALIFQLDTGTITPIQVAGVGIICSAVASAV